MLANDADIVFLIDKSLSDGEEFSWIGDIVNRAGGLDDYLTHPARDISPKYGLIGFGDGVNESTLNYAHSHLLDVNDTDGDGDQLFGTAAQLGAIADNNVIANSGSDERVWDAIEHAIAEYEFRPGAAVIFVAFRRADNGNFAGNETPPSGDALLRDGILAAMESYNVGLNSIVEATFDSAMFDQTLGGIVLGVEADENDGTTDGEHIAHVVNPVPNQPVGPEVLQISHNGSNSDTFVATGNSIRASTTDDPLDPNIVGPDRFGYGAELTSDPFEDISATGTLITQSDWGFSFFSRYRELTATDLGGFSFDFYGTTYTNLFVNEFGTITFGGFSNEFQGDDWNVMQPVRPTIAPLWDDFDSFGEPGNVYWQIEAAGTADERLIVQWAGMNFDFDSGFGPTETVTFQAALYSQTGDIVFRYDDLDVTDANFTNGRDATVGIATDNLTHPDVIPAGVFVDGAHAISTFDGVEDDFVRLAWETGGVAWNNESISSNSNPFAAEFDIAFIESIADQILDKHSVGDLAFADDPLFEINLGGPTVGNYLSVADFEQLNGIDIFPEPVITETTVDTIVANGNSMSNDANTLSVFQTGLTGAGSPDYDLRVDLPASTVPNGSYVVELMFAEIREAGANRREFNVFMEETELLHLYDVQNDYAKIPTTGIVGPEFEAFPELLQLDVPIVKRFAVDVTDGDGLQIHLDQLSSTAPASAPLLNGLRIFETPSSPRITDVRLFGSGWTGLGPYSFAQRVQVGEQLRPIATELVDTLEIQFNEHVTKPSGASLDGTELQLKYTTQKPNGGVTQVTLDSVPDDFGFNYNNETFLATWTFTNPLPDGKYAIHLDANVIENQGGNKLDADWTNDSPLDPNVDPMTGARTWDDFTDDLPKNFATDLGNGSVGTEGGEFRFHFALLVGDYDGSGDVNGGDDLALVTAGGVTQDLSADGNGDGVVDFLADRTIWVLNAGSILPLRALFGADLINDEKVDGQDIKRWEQGFGTPGGAGDVDGDGDSDGRDLILIGRAFNTFSAWYTGEPMDSMGNALQTIGLPPQVLNVIISGSASTHAPFSLDTVDGSGSQLGTVPVGGADTVSIVFSENVNVSAGSLYVVGLYTANTPALAAFSYDAATFTATWRFESWALGDQYLLSLSDMIADVDGNRLDGEWVNPASVSTVNSLVSTFPSGDGIAGGRFNFVATILPGDLDLNGIVDDTDLLMYDEGLDQYGHLQSGVAWFQGDVNGDGVVDELDDWNLFVAHEGLDLQDLWVLGDIDGNFKVDDTDIDLIAGNIGMTGATLADGDLDGNGVVDLADLDLAFAQYGMDLAVAS